MTALKSLSSWRDTFDFLTCDFLGPVLEPQTGLVLVLVLGLEGLVLVLVSITRDFHHSATQHNAPHRIASVFRSVAKKVGNARACGKQLEPCCTSVYLCRSASAGGVPAELRRGALLYGILA